MITVCVSENELRFPLDKNIWENPNIWYHGTSSAYSNKIEREGLRAGDLPYSILDVRKIVEIYDTIRVRNSSQDIPKYFDSILYTYTLENTNGKFEKSAISLTRDYWRARNYAMNNGGETINAMIQACEYFSKLVNDRTSNEEHRQRLRRGIDDVNKQSNKEIVQSVETLSDKLCKMKECQRNFLNRQYLKKCEVELENIKNKHDGIIGNSYPVVYAAEFKTPEKVLKCEGTDPYNPKWSSWLECERDSISNNKIICRIDFPNGISNYYTVEGGHWIKNKLLPWRS